MVKPRWALRLIGLSLFVFLLLRLDWDLLLIRLVSINVVDFVIAGLGLIPILLLRTLRWRSLLGNVEIPAKEALGLYSFSAFAGAVTPGQLGEFTKVWELKKWNVPTSRAVFSAIVDRCWDLAFLLGFAGFFSWEAFPHWRIIGFILVMSGLLLYLLGHRFLFRVLSGKLRSQIRTIKNELPMLERNALLLQACSSLVIWLINWGSIWVAITGLGLPLTFFELCGSLAVCALAAVLPLSVLGLGTRDALLILLLKHVADIGAVDAMALSGVVLAHRLLFALICGLVGIAFVNHRGFPSVRT